MNMFEQTTWDIYYDNPTSPITFNIADSIKTFGTETEIILDGDRGVIVHPYSDRAE